MSDTLWPFYHLHRLKLGAVPGHFRSTQREKHLVLWIKGCCWGIIIHFPHVSSAATAQSKRLVKLVADRNLLSDHHFSPQDTSGIFWYLIYSLKWGESISI